MTMKDPAFLFYSKDFYEGTRMMLPEERACFIDLLIYQHQNDFIPNDIKRIAMYCNGINESIVNSTLIAKFTLCDNGWYNNKLKNVILERKNFSEKQSENGIIGNFWKKSKSILDKKSYDKLKISLKNIEKKDFLELVNTLEINKLNLNNLINKNSAFAMRTHLEDEDVDVIEDVIVNKNIDEEIKKEFENFQISEQWENWKNYKLKIFNFKYASSKTEILAIRELKEMSSMNISVAEKIINKSMANNWKGFFPLNDSNKKTDQKNFRNNRPTN